MNWIKENKFLAGFFAAMLVGIGGLGYLLYSAMGTFDEATARYTAQASELSRLQNLAVSPSQKNLTALAAQKDEAVKVIAAFQSSLATKSFPAEPMTPEQFQDKLKATKNAVAQKAQAATKLPDKFFLGFDPYETRPPDNKEVATLLGHELKAIEWLILELIENHATEIKPMKREPLPEESGKGRGAEKGDKKGKPLVNSHPVDISIQCRPNTLASFLNAIVSPKAPQFYIVRTVFVKNQNEKGPPKVLVAPPPPPSPALVPPPPGAPQPASQPQVVSTYIVGEELIDVVMQIEIVDFAEPSPASTK